MTDTNYNGANVTISTNTTWYGRRYNIGTFVINPGVTLTVEPYISGSDTDDTVTGRLVIEAAIINIQGIIDGSGRGYGGGGGGGGGDAFAASHVNQAGAGGLGTQGGSAGIVGMSQDVPRLGREDFLGGDGGVGGHGGGTYGGAGGAGGLGGIAEDNGLTDATIRLTTAGSVGSKGGYHTNGGQGDTTIGDEVYMGGGGGGAGGGGAGSGRGAHRGYSAGTGGGGGAGNKGGSYVKLIASIQLLITGTINCKGLSASSGNGVTGLDPVNVDNGLASGRGGHASSAGSSTGGSQGSAAVTRYDENRNVNEWSYPRGTWRDSDHEGRYGATGATGAGGGVLLKCTGILGIYCTGTIDVRGGGNSTTNGGTVKIHALNRTYTDGNISRGRLHLLDAVVEDGALVVLID